MSNTTLANPTRIELENLLELRAPARLMPLHSRKIRSQMAGSHVSGFRGRGMEFDELRNYQPGDDTRTIDWRATARRGKPYTKLFREERERPVLLCVDLRVNQFFATRGVYKAVQASRAAALAAWSALHQGDRIGGLVFSETEHRELKPRRGKGALMRFFNQLHTHPAWEPSMRRQIDPKVATDSFNAAIQRLERVVHPGSLVVIASDFRGMNPEAESRLNRLGRHSDTVLMFVHDPIEAEPPRQGHYWVSDGEREQYIDTGNTRLTEQWTRHFDDHWQRLRRISSQQGNRLIRCQTHTDLIDSLYGQL